MAEPVIFPVGEFYSCTDEEHLTCQCPEEALEQFLDGYLSPECDVAAVIREIGEVTVKAYQPVVLSEESIGALALQLVERARDQWREKCGDPDGDVDLEPGPLAETEKQISAILTELFATQTPWSCEQCGEVTLTPEQVDGIMRDECPEWFDDGEARHA